MRTSLHLSTVLSLLSYCTGQYHTTRPWCYHSQYSCDDTCEEPGKWSHLFPECGGQRQSPINIVTSTVQYDPDLHPFTFEGHDHISNITVDHLGHSAHFALPQSVRIRGGGLASVYKALQFHLHWGVEAGPGSEHTVDGERYPMELHIVHIKEEYQSLEEAESDSAGIAVLGFFFEASQEDNPHFDTVLEALRRVRFIGNTSSVAAFKLSDIIPPAHELSAYYRYAGSMTTPACNEAVIWTIFHRTLPASHRQLVEVAGEVWYWTGKPMTNIFRPAQQLNGRVVSRSSPLPDEPPFSAYSAVPVLSGSAFCLCSVLVSVSLC
ncbi:carbonic anhydrase IV c [Sardina pilchardus]|uniref:carbonic anhydrase IV c n=1 Tax=Sardina pilchardus TaxID=27697 RepID=UPI002E0DFD99